MDGCSGRLYSECRCFRVFILSFILISTSTLARAYLYEGDIWFDGEEENADSGSTTILLNNAVLDPSLRWENSVVPYRFRKSFASEQGKANVEAALADLMKKTCVRFVPRTNEPYFLDFARKDPTRCFSTVGRNRTRGGQLINLGVGCDDFGTIQHEVLHALGFWHEQSRSDRDQYVIIKWNNVINGTDNSNFNAVRTDNLDMPYDYGSIMHYEWNAFAIDETKPTIVPKNPWPNARLGNRDVVSALDVLKINRLYNCYGRAEPPKSGTRAHTGLKWVGNWALDCDFPGDDLFIHQFSESTQCDLACLNTPGCTHFAWSDIGGGTCGLKEGGKSKEDAIKVTDQSVVHMCGVAQPVSGRTTEWKGNWAFGCDFPGNDLGYANAPMYNCEPICAAYQGCTHFKWTEEEEGTCWLKQGTKLKGDAVQIDDKSVVCGVLKRASSQLKTKTYKPATVERKDSWPWSDEIRFPNSFPSSAWTSRSSPSWTSWSSPSSKSWASSWTSRSSPSISWSSPSSKSWASSWTSRSSPSSTSWRSYSSNSWGSPFG
ncbi:hypothetical protein RvY_11416 [Ramazzottius varieornatus]|uniref:Metalloendopeptidase n=1 Tax=Ramazzottius varieornatus TaxID=947166 RepID=A0A1D1VG42_RAMVA|nr:hypothetical protein RvY_11416 [Ramazzottius varieornatus]